MSDPVSRLCRELPAACRAAGAPAQTPAFAYRACGPDHAPLFVATCTIPDGPSVGWPERVDGEARGTKREAKTSAAAAVLREVERARRACPPPCVGGLLRADLLEWMAADEAEACMPAFLAALRVLQRLGARDLDQVLETMLRLHVALADFPPDQRTLVRDYLPPFLR